MRLQIRQLRAVSGRACSGPSAPFQAIAFGETGAIAARMATGGWTGHAQHGEFCEYGSPSSFRWNGSAGRRVMTALLGAGSKINTDVMQMMQEMTYVVADQDTQSDGIASAHPELAL